MTRRKTLSQEAYALVDMLYGGRFVFEPRIYAMPKVFHLSAISLL